MGTNHIAVNASKMEIESCWECNDEER